MRKVAILGIGQIRVDEHWDKTLLEMAGEAVFAALNDAGRDRVEGLFVGNMLASQLDKQSHLGALIADWVGFRGIEAMTVEAACASGSMALRTGVMAVASGMLDSVIAVGVEKMTDSPPHETTAALATAADADWEVIHGITFVGLNALLMRRYMYEYGWKHEDFAPFSVNAHANGAKNPFARFQRPITVETYKKAPMISDPVNLMDSSPIGDGAAAALIVPVDSIQKRGGRPLVTIEGSASAIDAVAVHDRHDPLWLSAAEKSSQRAYRQAGVGPNDIDFFEIHDAFSIMSALSLEACGFAERGQGPRLALDGAITPQGSIPLTTLGGLKARGHPVGATGMYQIVEVVQQLRGEAGAAQIDGAKIGMAQNIGGSGATIVTHILKARG
ncbi:MAG: acetyl-CoA acetyltransferase [Anaerolineaceae bacterium 4572_5.1]|nr:MAG: acetyl-CoA acetyltransferase [Anaerolineaceae bacterium 4572_5.1]RLD10236.1 MAG: thiolase domain-containing protein [Chloroflexota bacterium]